MEGLGFLQWEQLLNYQVFVSLVFLLVEFTKEIKYIKLIPTKYWSATISFVLMITIHLHNGTFAFWDLVLYALSSILLSLTANGLSQFNKKGNV